MPHQLPYSVIRLGNLQDLLLQHFSWRWTDLTKIVCILSFLDITHNLFGNIWQQLFKVPKNVVNLKMVQRIWASYFSLTAPWSKSEMCSFNDCLNAAIVCRSTLTLVRAISKTVPIIINLCVQIWRSWSLVWSSMKVCIKQTSDNKITEITFPLHLE